MSRRVAGSVWNLAFVFIAIVSSARPVAAQVDIPKKSYWTLSNGTLLQGEAYDFGYHLCFLQRRLGNLYLNGEELESAMGHALLAKLCEEKGIDLSDERALQKRMAKERFAQLVMPFFTLRYHDEQGLDREVPTILLHKEEQNLLRPAAKAWLEQKQKEHEEQLRYAQELANERQRLLILQQSLQVMRSMEQAAWAQVYELRAIGSSLR